ncbi:unnamed protein product [Caenorhabditis angaria]|uniref:Uncharacterized protein n=1 Tax=Caenorhabditis angaria TaxID=860376 RepID=A0A9P1I8C8_9PELO|nr:unnamed protein product [Caenorhabditis angaria]
MQTTVVDESSLNIPITILVEPHNPNKPRPISRNSSNGGNLTPIENSDGLVTKDLEPITVVEKESTVGGDVDCPFKIHGCHKRGGEMDVKRHVRDDRNS